MKYSYVIERVLDLFPDLSPEYVAPEIRQSSFVSLDKRYLYFEVPKAACTQMKELLRAVENAPSMRPPDSAGWLSRRDMFVHYRPNVPLPSLVDLDNKAQREVLESSDFLRMTIVRNPYTRVVSTWRNKVFLCEPGVGDIYSYLKGGLPDIYDKSLVSFEEFIRYLEKRGGLHTCNCHWRRQVDHTFYPALNFSFIGKLEKFGEALRHFEQHLGHPLPLAAQRRNSSFPVGSAAYTQELADRVYSLYQRDFEVFGYERDSWMAFGPKGEESTAVPVEIFLNEVIERNLVIQGLYLENGHLEAQLRRVSRLHLLTAINGLAACRSAVRRAIGGLVRWTRSTPPPNQRKERSGVTPA